MSQVGWRESITAPKEIALFEALDDPKFIWRTRDALVRESGMREDEVIAALWKHSDYVIEGRTHAGDPIWALRSRYWNQPGISGIFNIISSTSVRSA